MDIQNCYLIVCMLLHATKEICLVIFISKQLFRVKMQHVAYIYQFYTYIGNIYILSPIIVQCIDSSFMCFRT